MSIAPVSDKADASSSIEAIEDDVHVWLLPSPVLHSAAGRECQEERRCVLSTDEKERAERFHFAHHARHYVANRGRLRMLLGKYLEQEPAGIIFTYNAYGKPGLATGPIKFNLSHTDGMAAVAVSRSRSVGIDIERSSRASDAMEVARRYFSRLEVDALHNYAGAEQQVAFLRCWTCKEAFLKALGDGLSRPLAEFSTSWWEQAPSVLACKWDPHAPHRWQLTALACGPHHVGTLASEIIDGMYRLETDAEAPREGLGFATTLFKGKLKTFAWSQEVSAA